MTMPVEVTAYWYHSSLTETSSTLLFILLYLFIIFIYCLSRHIVGKAEFLTSADLLNVPLTEVKDRMILWDKLFPSVFNHPASKFVRVVVLNRYYITAVKF